VTYAAILECINACNTDTDTMQASDCGWLAN
jgi:hypothetical protein